MDMPLTRELFRRVHRRMQVATFADRTWLALGVLLGIYAVALLATRLLGLVQWPELPVLYSLPAVAVIIGWFTRKRVLPAEAARAIDQHVGAPDLFLTVSLLESSAGEFQPLVARAAESQAPRVQAENVVPFRFQRRLLITAAAILAIVPGVLFVPTLDPFGHVQASQEVAKKQAQIEKDREVVKKRIEELKQEEATAEHSEQVDRELTKLKQEFKAMKPGQPKENSSKLASEQKALGKLLQKVQAEKMAEMMNQMEVSQQFGGGDSEKFKEWSEEMKKGSTSKMEREISEIQDTLKRLAKADNPAERDKIARELRKKLENLSDFAEEKAGSPGVKAALQKALQQLDMASKSGPGEKQLAEDAMKALQESLELSKAELQQMAQAARDMKSLEKALEALQMAKQLNDKERLDGEAAEGASSMEDYAELYARLLGEEGMGEGEGEGEGDGDDTGGKGMGRGGKVPEDESLQTGFKSEVSKTKTVKGKVLMTLKSKGQGDKGDVKTDFRAAAKIDQDVSSAIEADQIPPGYHDGIKGYFDTLNKE